MSTQSNEKISTKHEIETVIQDTKNKAMSLIRAAKRNTTARNLQNQLGQMMVV